MNDDGEEIAIRFKQGHVDGKVHHRVTSYFLALWINSCLGIIIILFWSGSQAYP